MKNLTPQNRPHDLPFLFMASSGLAIGAAACYLTTVLAFAITSIVLGAGPSPCDNPDLMGLDVGQYLVGLGSATLALIALATLGACFRSQAFIITVVILSTLFSLAWFIVGGVVLFRSNLECIHTGVPMVCFAVYMWASSALGWFMTCCGTKVSAVEV